VQDASDSVVFFTDIGFIGLFGRKLPLQLADHLGAHNPMDAALSASMASYADTDGGGATAGAAFTVKVRF
jgi:hypothetical protein